MISMSEGNTSGQGQNRTADTRIFSPLLYQLSYLAGRPVKGAEMYPLAAPKLNPKAGLALA
jgi:hypothetical protein